MSYSNSVNSRPGTTRRVRLKDYDYSTPGYYFITICTHDRHHYFGSITNDQMIHSSAGLMVNAAITECEDRFQSVSIDTHIVMPNHIHILIGLAIRLEDEPGIDNLIDVIHWIKSTTHQRYRAGVRRQRWNSYNGAVWQEGYHDHIVRNERELGEIRAYVMTNVERWDKDTFYDGINDCH